MKTFIYENIFNKNMRINIESVDVIHAGWILETFVMNPNDFKLINKTTNYENRN